MPRSSEFFPPRLTRTPLQVDQIYHLACPASPVHYKYNPVKTIKVGWREELVGFRFA